MFRTLFLLALLASPSLAQPAPEPKDGKITIPFTMHPEGVKKPLSRYYLTPRYIDMQPGNKVPTLMKAFMEQDLFFAREQSEKRQKWNALPLDKLPLEEIRSCGAIGGLAYRTDPDALFQSYGRPLGDVDEAARQLTADWQIWFHLRADGMGTLLPEVQRIRELANVLKVRMRYEIRQGEFDKAIYSAQTFHGMATTFEAHPTLIGLLVGLAIEHQNLDAIEEMIQQPGCPNLYWSLTEFPAEVLNNRLASGAERLIADSLFRPLQEAKGPLSETELYAQMKKFDVIPSLVGGEKPLLKYSLDAPIRSTDRKKVAAAKALLVETGMNSKLVDRFSDLQLIIMADIKQYEIFVDATMIANFLPYPEAIKHVKDVEERLKKEGTRIAQLLMPSNRGILDSLVRARQRVAYLRTLEAIRLYAHEHEGKLPATLSDITVPLPSNPVTGKPFAYSLKNGVARLESVASPDSKSDPRMNRSYEIRIKN